MQTRLVTDSVYSTCVSHMQNHTSQTQVGQVFSAITPAPRLAIATHLSVNEYSIVPIISAIRSTYPVGPLAIAQDLVAWDISPSNITQRRYTASAPAVCLLSPIWIHACRHQSELMPAITNVSSCLLPPIWVYAYPYKWHKHPCTRRCSLMHLCCSFSNIFLCCMSQDNTTPTHSNQKCSPLSLCQLCGN